MKEYSYQVLDRLGFSVPEYWLLYSLWTVTWPPHKAVAQAVEDSQPHTAPLYKGLNKALPPVSKGETEDALASLLQKEVIEIMSDELVRSLKARSIYGFGAGLDVLEKPAPGDCELTELFAPTVLTALYLIHGLMQAYGIHGMQTFEESIRHDLSEHCYEVVSTNIDWLDDWKEETKDEHANCVWSAYERVGPWRSRWWRYHARGWKALVTIGPS